MAGKFDPFNTSWALGYDGKKVKCVREWSCSYVFGETGISAQALKRVSSGESKYCCVDVRGSSCSFQPQVCVAPTLLVSATKKTIRVRSEGKCKSTSQKKTAILIFKLANFMFGEKAVELLKELKRSTDEALVPYNVSLF